MKFHTLVLLCFLAISCQKTFEKPMLPSGDSLMATLENNKTKTSLDGSQVLWSEGDMITVFDVSLLEEASYSGVKYLLDPSCAGMTKGKFNPWGQARVAGEKCYAGYPSDKVSGACPDGLAFILPEVQNYMPGSFGNGNNPAVSCGRTDSELNFKNVCGLLSVTISGMQSVGEICLTSLGEEALWGDGFVDMREMETPTLVMTGEITDERRTTSIFIPHTEDAACDDVQTVCFTIPVGALSKGFMITILGTDGQFMQKYARPCNENVIERSKCTAMPAITFKAGPKINVRTDVKNKAYYKDMFNDLGIGTSDLDYNNPAYTKNGFTVEYVDGPRNAEGTAKNKERMVQTFTGYDIDSNGVLLFPDGEPRFGILYVNGGRSVIHGQKIGKIGLQHIRDFYYNGGSYSGSCGGMFLACNGRNATYNEWYLHLYDAMFISTGYNRQIGLNIPADSHLLDYYDFGGDYYVDDVNFRGGPILPLDRVVPGSEILSYVNYPSDTQQHGSVAQVAYKHSEYTGRMVLSTGHPEHSTVIGGEILNNFFAMLKYAYDGRGIAKVKGELVNRTVRYMTKSTEDNDPSHTKIGDKQCHHFVCRIPDGAKNIVIRMECLGSNNLSLRLAHDTFAFKEDAEYSVENTELVKELRFDSLPKGIYYVGVQCEDTVTCTNDEYGFVYSGKTAVLNGVPYSISLSWEIGAVPAGEIFFDGQTESMGISTLSWEDVPEIPGQASCSTETMIVNTINNI